MDRTTLFPQLKDCCYLDHAGAGLPSLRQLESHSKFLQTVLLMNPHSYGVAHSDSNSDYVEEARERVLSFFGVTREEYTLVFTSGATESIRKVGEWFSYGSNGLLCYLNDNHTSVLGVREYALTRGAQVSCVTEDMILHVRHGVQGTESTANKPSTYTKPPATRGLFIYPAQSNFSGRKYNLNWARQLKEGTLSVGSACTDWYVMLDAASLVATSPLDLHDSDIDFIPISFYKIFGHPTGLGALLVKNTAISRLKKVYFGGGTVEGAGVDKFFHYPRHNKSQWLEDGTVAFQQIAALQFGFDEISTRGGMDTITSHTYQLAKLTHDTLQSLTHYNGSPLAQLYCDTDFRDHRLQGAIVTFNLLRSNGDLIGYNEVQCMANIYKVIFRTGCFCNIGACQKYLHISTQQLHDNHQLGHRCGDAVDMVEGRPTGAVRVSFGYMSSLDDAQTLVRFIKECFAETVAKPGPEPTEELQAAPSSLNSNETVLSSVCLFPVKSCAGFQVEEWPVSESGLLYDRRWAIVDAKGSCLNLKRNADLRKIHPRIDLERSTLCLSAEGFEDLTIPVEETAPISVSSETMEMCTVKVCGKMVETVDCGTDASLWISDVLAMPGCRLVRQLPPSRNKDDGEKAPQSLANDSQYLLISQSSVHSLCTYISDEMNSDVEEMEITGRFRANLIVSGGEADDECQWEEVQIGNHLFKCQGECERCAMVSVDQETGVRMKEPLRSLTTRKGAKAAFGIHLASMDYHKGMVKVGDAVLVTKRH